MDAPAFIEQHDYEKGFAAYFDRELKGQLTELEEKRLKGLAVSRRRAPWAIAASVLLVGVIVWYYVYTIKAQVETLLPFVFVGCLYGMASAYGWWYKPRKDYLETKKGIFLQKIASYFGTFVYTPAPSIDPVGLKKLHFVPVGDKGVRTMDGLKGTYQGTPVEMCFVSIPDSRGNTRRTDFSGYLFTLGMRKPFAGETLLLQKIDAFDAVWQAPEGLHEIHLEDPEISKRFRIVASDQIEARYLLTPDIMENIVRLHDMSGKAWMQCAFVGGAVHIAIESVKPLFAEGNIHLPVYDYDEVHAFIDRLHAVLSLIDLLKVKG